LRFQVLCDVAPLAGRTLHDVGCGAGHLADWLRTRGIATDYSGSDASPRMLEEARRLHPDLRFDERDFRRGPPAERWDVLVCSGMLHVKLDRTDAEWWSFVQDVLRNMFAACRVAIAFNLMSDRVDWRAPELFYASPGAVLDFCRSELSRWVTLRHDYPLHEFTVHVHRDPPARSG
jgi:SAM-dependent methyltransferase